MQTTLEKIYYDIGDTSTKISTLLRNLNFGLFILCGGMLLQPSDTATWLPRRGLILICGLAILALFLDYLQLLMGYLDSREVQKKTERNAKDTALAAETPADYNTGALPHRARRWFFYSKQAITAINVGVFLLMAACKIVESK